MRQVWDRMAYGARTGFVPSWTSSERTAESHSGRSENARGRVQRRPRCFRTLLGLLGSSHKHHASQLRLAWGDQKPFSAYAASLRGSRDSRRGGPAPQVQEPHRASQCDIRQEADRRVPQCSEHCRLDMPRHAMAFETALKSSARDQPPPSIAVSNAQSSHGAPATMSSASTVQPHHIRRPAGALRWLSTSYAAPSASSRVFMRLTKA